MKILFAEDEPEILRLYALVLRDDGYEVSTTIDGQECLNAFRTEFNNGSPFDLVIVDYRMPRKNGVEVAKEILALRPNQELLMVTAYKGQLDLQDQTLREMRILEKPFEVEELLSAVGQLVSRPVA